MAAHSAYGPSSLSKRAGCPGSAAEEAGLDDESFDEYRDSGVVCHKAMENLVHGEPLPDLDSEEYKLVTVAIKQMNFALAGDRIIPGELRTENGGVVLCEHRFDRLPYSIGQDDQCGTLDLCIHYPGSHFLMLDWKFGGSFVPAPAWNWQMKAYATGLWAEFDKTIPVNLAIVQPQASEPYQMVPWVYDPADAKQFCLEIRQIIERCQDPAAPRCVGKSCQFCRAAKHNTCMTRQSALGALAPLGPDWKAAYRAMTPIERGRLLTAMKAAIRVAEGVIDFSREMIHEDGEVPPGWSATPVGQKGTLRIAARPSQPSWPSDAPKIKVA